MGEKTVKLVEDIAKKDTAIMQIIDKCDTKREYKEFVNFCKAQKKIFKETLKLDPEDWSIYTIRSLKINETVTATSVIRNFDPESYNIRDKFPAEIQVTISDGNKRTDLTTKGSGFLGGCNEAEYNEFLSLLKDAIPDFKYVKENKESEDGNN